MTKTEYLFDNPKYQIKPEKSKEPIYEWQFAIKRSEDSMFDMTGYYTESEIENMKYYYWLRFEPSKRIREM